MGERNITLFAVHLHNNGDIQIGPERISTGGEEESRVRRKLTGTRNALPIPLAAGAIALFAFLALAWRAIAGR